MLWRQSANALHARDTAIGVFPNQLVTVQIAAHDHWPVVVRRYLDGDQLIWEYADGSITRMKRICGLPPEHKTPSPRGAQLKLF